VRRRERTEGGGGRTVEAAAAPADLPDTEHGLGLAVDDEDVLGAELVGVLRVRQEVGVDRARDGEPQALLGRGGLAVLGGRRGGRRELEVERERNRVLGLRAARGSGSAQARRESSRGEDEDEGRTVPLRLLARSSSPSRVVSAGSDTDGPSSVPSWALRNWQMMVWTGPWAATAAAATDGAVRRWRFGRGGMTVDMLVWCSWTEQAGVRRARAELTPSARRAQLDLMRHGERNGFSVAFALVQLSRLTASPLETL